MIEFEVGQIVEVYNNTCCHEFCIGELVRVKNIDINGEVSVCEHLDGRDWWWADSEDVRHVEGESK